MDLFLLDMYDLLRQVFVGTISVCFRFNEFSLRGSFMLFWTPCWWWKCKYMFICLLVILGVSITGMSNVLSANTCSFWLWNKWHSIWWSNCCSMYHFYIVQVPKIYLKHKQFWRTRQPWSLHSKLSRETWHDTLSSAMYYRFIYDQMSSVVKLAIIMTPLLFHRGKVPDL